MTVSPLDGGQEWDVPAAGPRGGVAGGRQGVELDGLASIRLQEAGVGSAHPEYVAGLLQAITGRWKVAATFTRSAILRNGIDEILRLRAQNDTLYLSHAQNDDIPATRRSYGARVW